jgi:hypothetical protein
LCPVDHGGTISRKMAGPYSQCHALWACAHRAPWAADSGCIEESVVTKPPKIRGEWHHRTKRFQRTRVTCGVRAGASHPGGHPRTTGWLVGLGRTVSGDGKPQRTFQKAGRGLIFSGRDMPQRSLTGLLAEAFCLLASTRGKPVRHFQGCRLPLPKWTTEKGGCHHPSFQ